MTYQQASTAHDRPGVADAFTVLARWNWSLAAFYLRRWQRQMELPVQLLAVATPGDLVALRSAFERDLIADYLDQAEDLFRVCGGSGHSRGPKPGMEPAEARKKARDVVDQARAEADRIVRSARARAEEIIAAGAAGRPGAKPASRSIRG